MILNHSLILERTDNKLRARIVCPFCENDRKKKNERCMSVTRFRTGDKLALYNCHHCNESSAIFKKGNEMVAEQKKVQLIEPKVTAKVVSIEAYKGKDAGEAVFKWLTDNRKISVDIFHAKYHCFSDKQFFPSSNKEEFCVGIPFFNEEGEKYAVKYRSVESKAFTQRNIIGTGGAKTFFGIEQIPNDADQIIIVEGELDLLAIKTVMPDAHVMSVPNGAPNKISTKEINEDTDNAFKYFYSAKDKILSAKKIVLARDNDAPGEALVEELARRIGKAKCLKVSWNGKKDANDVLQESTEALVECIENAVEFPIKGLYSPNHYKDGVMQLYEEGYAGGLSTGLENVDNLFTIAEGQLTIVTGHPSSGKSEFVDQLLVNLTELHGYKHCLCSFENDPRLHVIKLLEKRLRKPFMDGPTARLTREEVEEGMKWINENFLFMENADGTQSSIESILERARDAIFKIGIRTLVIDPYNYIDIDKKTTTETDAISTLLTKIRLFAQANQIHVFFVAHPSKMARENGKVQAAMGYDVSGSANWFSKTDNGITIHRDKDNEGVTEFHCWKVRYKWVGNTGNTTVSYEKATGIYSSLKFDEKELDKLDAIIKDDNKRWYDNLDF